MEQPLLLAAFLYLIAQPIARLVLDHWWTKQLYLHCLQAACIWRKCTQRYAVCLIFGQSFQLLILLKLKIYLMFHNPALQMFHNLVIQTNPVWPQRASLVPTHSSTGAPSSLRKFMDIMNKINEGKTCHEIAFQSCYCFGFLSFLLNQIYLFLSCLRHNHTISVRKFFCMVFHLTKPYHWIKYFIYV